MVLQIETLEERVILGNGTDWSHNLAVFAFRGLAAAHDWRVPSRYAGINLLDGNGMLRIALAVLPSGTAGVSGLINQGAVRLTIGDSQGLRSDDRLR